MYLLGLVTLLNTMEELCPCVKYSRGVLIYVSELVLGVSVDMTPSAYLRVETFQGIVLGQNN